MPARTTVITSLTKKINSEVIKLKTSQVLQMAGRAGRRGIDVEGNVIVMRNKFDELKLAHSILVSKVDGIKSHFKASYGFAVKLLETRSLSECRALMERGFGAYSMMKRIQRRASLGDIQTQEERAQEFRSVLLKYGVKESRDYVKILRRMVREERQLEDFKQAMHRQDDELVNALAEYVPLGSMLLLKSGETAYFLGDAQHYDQSVDPGAVMTTKQSSYAIITSGDARILLIQSQHIQSFAGTEEGLSAKAAALLTDFVPTVQRWRPLASHGKDEILEAVLDWSTLPQTSMLAQIVQQIIDYPATMTPEEDPTFLAQQGLVHDLQHQVGKHPISQQNDSKLIVEAVKYLGEVNNPMMWLDQQPSMEMQVTNSNNTTTTTTPQYNIYAWKLFENTLRILQKFNALDENYQTTPFGQLVSSLTTENELWLAMILQQEGVERLEAPELAALVCATMIDGKRASNTYVKTEPSENVKVSDYGF